MEELGVVPDELHELTAEDLLQGNIDLERRACKLLQTKVERGESAIRRLRIESHEIVDTKLHLRLSCRGLRRLDFFLNGRPVATFDVEGGPELDYEIPTMGMQPRLVEIAGFAHCSGEGLEPVACRKIRL